MQKKKVLCVFAGVILILGCICFCLLLNYRKKLNDTGALSSYRISCTDETEDLSKLTKDLVKSRFSEHMKDASPKSHLYLHIAADDSSAANLGYSMEAVPANSFLIARSGNGLFVLGHNKETAISAIYYLINHLTDSDGRLLLNQDENYVSPSKRLVMVYDAQNTPLSEYTLVCEKKLVTPYGELLNSYLAQSIGHTLPVSPEDTGAVLSEGKQTPVFSISVDNSLESSYRITSKDHLLRIVGQDEAGLKAGIIQFANTYLGFMFAGTDREKISTYSTSIHLPEFKEQSPWMEEREPIVTLWNTNYSRGIFLNDSTSLKTDIMSFSDEQLYEYVKMMKYCGFTGIQATDMCSAWAGAGGYEYVQQRLRFMADAAHSLDMKFTLWVWGAEFTGYGWVDNSVVYYSQDGTPSRECPEVIATFDKYYSIYASLADCCDRVISHFYDPGNLSDSDDIAFFAGRLRDKFKAINPDIDFGISCWVDKYDKSRFIAALGSDITLYENGHHDVVEDYNSFRSFCSAAGCRVGTWAWNTCEMEIDQVAQMNFNPHIIKSTYETARNYDSNSKPNYWSEMDSNHVINVFSLYCAAQLLINPDLDPEELTFTVANAVVDQDNVPKLAYILSLIEDARSGQDWSTYIWSSENYVLKSPDYPASEILERSTTALSYLSEMLSSGTTSYSLPLPMELSDLLHLLEPQLEQIRSYALFRLGYEELLELQNNGVSDDVLLEKIDSIKTPVSEYNTVTGLWGQIESRAQQELLTQFCLDNNLIYRPDPTFKQTQKNRIYSYFVSYQKGKSKPFPLYSPYFQYGVAYGNDTTIALVEELISEGLLCRADDGGVYLTDWEHYKFNFN